MKTALALMALLLAAACAGDRDTASAAEGRSGSGRVVPAATSTAPPHGAPAAMTKEEGRLVERALSGIRPSRPSVSEYFFVGLAGWADEDVFLNEARAAADLFRRRFGAGGRTLLLVNNPQTTGELPGATVPTLRAAIGGIARKMGDEDVLFLYITSHGHRRRVSLRGAEGELPDLRAGELRRILDAARIGNRVIAISACYSGSFVGPLESERTLVMTAAAADRPSFGCGHDGPFTYFGRALIGEALEKEFSFPRAFEAASRAIEVREKDEGLRPSRPQISAGAKIGPVLDGITRRLEKRRGAP